MYVNGEYKGDDPLGRLMHDFSTANAVKNFYANGISLAIIAKSLNLTEEQVKEILNEKSPVTA